MLAFQAAALHRALQKRREELQKSLLVSYAASPRSAVQLRRMFGTLLSPAYRRRAVVRPLVRTVTRARARSGIA